MLRLLSRRKAQPPAAVAAVAAAAVPFGSEANDDRANLDIAARRHATLPQAAVQASAGDACALSTCIAGSRATILEVRCSHADACRLRALGLCEGAAVSVVNSRDCTLLEVRGARLAVSSAIAAGIMVMPIV